MRPLNACGVEAGSVKIQRNSADYGYIETNCLSGRWAVGNFEIDRVVHPVGDVEVVDAARPVDLTPPSMRISHPDIHKRYGYSPPAYAAQDNGDGAVCACTGKSACLARGVQFSEALDRINVAAGRCCPSEIQITKMPSEKK
jgi:hypothetical protein